MELATYSISVLLCIFPNDILRVLLARFSSIPILRKVEDALVVPEEQADPNEAAMPIRSRAIRSDCPSTFGNVIANTPGR